MKHLIRTSIAAGALSALVVFSNPAAAVPVGLELSLVIDVSGSVDASEYLLQRDGYEAAFNNASIQNAIANTAGGVAVNVIMFSSLAAQQIGWTLLNDAADAAAFATAIGNLARPVLGSQTGVASAMLLARNSIDGNGYEGARLVIDVSGDGSENVLSDAAVIAQRDLAALAGITVNGLSIEGSEAGITTWYQNHVITPDGFTVAAADFLAFEDAVIEKIGLEINPNITPEPTSFGLFGLSLAGLGLLRRREAPRG